MKNKINIAKILKDCPIGMELDCTMYEDVYFDYVDELNIIHCYIQCENYKTSITFNQHGTPNSDIKSKCVIFPKGKTTWEGFVPPCKFKDGDIVATNTGNWIGITAGGISDEELPTYCIIDPCNNLRAYFDKPKSWNFSRLATEEEKAKLFQAIKDNGYHWNTETKTLDKLVESKEDIDDKVVMSDIYFDREYYADKVELHLNNYNIKIRDGKIYAVFKNEKNKTLKPKFKIGDRVLCEYDIEIQYTISNRKFITEIGYVYFLNCDTCSSGWWKENDLIPFTINLT